jgi:hypothetical protein
MPERLRELLCRGLDFSLAALVYIYSDARMRRSNVLRTLMLMGLPLGEAEGIYREVDEALSSHVRVASFLGGESHAWRGLEGVVVKCLDYLNVGEEAWRRVEALDAGESRVVRMLSLAISKRAGQMYYARGWDVVSVEPLAELASVLLLEDVDPFTVERLLVGSFLAVMNYKLGAGGYVYRQLRLIPNTTSVVRALADSVASEWPSRDYIMEMLEGASTCVIAALLGAERPYYEAVYGCDYGVVLNSLAIRGIAYKGTRNRFVINELKDVARDLALKRCEDLLNVLTPALRSQGYTLPAGSEGLLSFEYCCRYMASKPGSLLAIYTCPYAVAPPALGQGERAVVIVEGMGAGLPEYIGYLRRTRHPAAEALWLVLHRNKVYIVSATVREDWQRRLVEALKAVSPGVAFI